MKNLSFKSKSVYAWLLLLPFLSIYLINISCTIGNLTHDWQFFASADNDNHHQHSHEHERQHADAHHEHNHNSDKNEEEDDGCCSDVTTAFFASVQVPPHNTTVDFTTFQFTVLYAVVNHLFTFDNLELYSDKKPPPKLPPKLSDIRIFLQSFQI